MSKIKAFHTLALAAYLSLSTNIQAQSYCQRFFQGIGNSVANSAAKILQKTPPKNYGVPFTPGLPRGTILIGVDPNTLIFNKLKENLEPHRIENAHHYAQHRSIQVTSKGDIIDGHHRTYYAIQHGIAVDVEIVIFD